MKKSLLLACMAMILATVSAPRVEAQSSIKVIVADQAITSYDIQQRARLISLTQRKSSGAATREAQEELIDDVLKLREARRMGVSVSKSEVDAAFASIAQRVNLTPQNLANALRQAGVNPETLRNRLKAEIAFSQLVRQRFRAEVQISETDIVNALRKARADENNKDKPADVSVEYELQQVIFVVPAKAKPNFKVQRKREAETLRKTFTSCEQGVPQARSLSEVVVKSIGFRLETELPADMKDVIAKTEVGRLTPPLDAERGIQMIAVCKKREIKSDISARTQIEDDLRQKEGEQLTRRYVQELRRAAVIVYK
ncbi:peptidylprolyl isomerase [Microvirga tunisiensis]|uniref:Peptidylprolyl isomerase n=2 Tax=Pannonibacter tanglangensis TaxID=2750084 RepID=A0A7X5F1E3_9HYPH|nr:MULTISPECIES: SurA N-terminal domain-containing protein [unclassified Pannonibacter]NBN64093.1 peptidylprolyl isomerase [Pannonibacter sp. XCT-34]NBN77734.1 peptidylprolyl isomerase [Pannonibacter sp. XCT-53]